MGRVYNEAAERRWRLRRWERTLWLLKRGLGTTAISRAQDGLDGSAVRYRRAKFVREGKLDLPAYLEHVKRRRRG